MANEGDTAASPIAAPAKEYPVERIARLIAAMSNGERSKLRRAYLHRNYEADGIIAGLLHRTGVTIAWHPEAFRPWKLVAHSAALLSGTGHTGAKSHSRGRPLGLAMHESGIKENLVLRLVSARGVILDALVIRTMRRIARQETRATNLLTLFDLVGHDDDRSEAARLRIAGDYYAAEARSEEGNARDD